MPLRSFGLVAALSTLPQIGLAQMPVDSGVKSATLSTYIQPFSLMDTHPIALGKPGPWFEGYYTRIVDHEQDLSFAFITTSYLSPGEEHRHGGDLKAYVTLFFQGPGQSKPVVIENFPEDSYFVSRGSRRLKDYRFSEKTDFSWVSKSAGRYTKDGADLTFYSPTGEVRLQAQFTKPKHWSGSSANSSPAGPITFFGAMPLQWYVYSLKSVVEYHISFPNGQTYSGSGHAHIEKNWGEVFPSAWIWMQGISDTGSEQIVLAGGRLDLPVIDKFDNFLFGLRSETHDLSFSPANSIFKMVDRNVCAGTMTIEARTLNRVVRVKAQAPPETFGSLSIPTRDGYVPGAVESFRTTLEVEVFDVPFFSDELTLKERIIFHDAALEFGADYYDCELRHLQVMNKFQ